MHVTATLLQATGRGRLPGVPLQSHYSMSIFIRRPPWAMACADPWARAVPAVFVLHLDWDDADEFPVPRYLAEALTV